MKNISIIFIVIAAMLTSCSKQHKNSLNKIFNPTNLPPQYFEIDIAKDTTLITKNGCIVKIASGSLQSKTNPVKLEIKEALKIEDILLAGLITKSGNDILSSAGMVYINGLNENEVTIKKAIQILVPTKSYNPEMQIYKGVKEDNNKIDWQAPTPLPPSNIAKQISVGEQIFKNNCSNCHKLEQDYTGPSLLGVTYRRPKKWLYEFTRNPAGTNDKYAECLKQTWQPIIMTAYPNLNNQLLDSLYAYIKSETDKSPKPNITDWATCCDSCVKYQIELAKLENKKTNLQTEQNNYYENQTTTTLQNVDIDSSTFFNTGNTVADFYTIDVDVMGWYNLDVLIKLNKNSVESDVIVKINDTENYIVGLVIPSYKIFVDGIKSSKGNYTFSYNDKPTITLPQNVICNVIAYRFKGDKILFAKSDFASTYSNTITLHFDEINKENLKNEFSKLLLNAKVEEVKVEEIKNEKEINNVVQQIDSLQKNYPKGCNCTYGTADSSSPMPNTGRSYLK